MTKKHARRSVHAIRVNQWLPGWSEIAWTPREHRSEPPHSFLVFSLSARDLRRLSGVYARTTKRKKAVEDLGIQRQLEEARSEEIKRFVEFGYPWSDLSKAKRQSSEYRDLRQPGWLPTAIVVNLLRSSDKRRGHAVDTRDLVELKEIGDGLVELVLPLDFDSKKWALHAIPPIEVIDGQHRLSAFSNGVSEGSFELPVVAFVGLDLSWQAYLFYTINIKPRRINPSLAFDLYPLLRTEEWLEKFEGHAIYRETRAQEIVDKLWSYEASPWHHRINMLGEKGSKGFEVTQNAWVRSLMASFVKSWEGRGVRIGGLFGSRIGKHEAVLEWSLEQQAAFLIYLGNEVQGAIEEVDDEWAEFLRHMEDMDKNRDAAFFGPNNLLNQDQGLRAFLQIANDLTFVSADWLGLHDVIPTGIEGDIPDNTIEDTIDAFYQDEDLTTLVRALANALASYDWRASGCPGLTDEQRTLKASFRGSGGYREVRRHLLQHLMEGNHEEIGEAAADVIARLGFE